MRHGLITFALILTALPAWAFIHAPPPTLKQMCGDHNTEFIRVLSVKARDAEKGAATFDVGETLKQDKDPTGVTSFRLVVRADAPGGKAILDGLTPGSAVVLFTREYGTGKAARGYGYAFCDAGWYFVDYNAEGGFWLFVRAEPPMCECYAGTAKALPDLVKALLAGKKVEVPTRKPAKDDHMRRALLVDEAMRKNRPTYPKVPLPTAWGKPIDGVQAGLRLNPAVPYPDAPAVLEVVIRNVGTEPVEFSHPQQEFTGENVAGRVALKASEVARAKGQRLSVLVSPGDSYALATLPAFEPGKAPKRAFSVVTIRPGANQVGAEAVVVQLAGNKDAELATGYLDVPTPEPKK